MPKFDSINNAFSRGIILFASNLLENYAQGFEIK